MTNLFLLIWAVLIVYGAMLICGAIFNWQWVSSGRAFPRERGYAHVTGRMARILALILGITAIGVSIFMLSLFPPDWL